MGASRAGRHVRGHLADSQEYVDVGRGSDAPDLLVGAHGTVAELEHLPEHGDRAPAGSFADPAQDVQGGGHGLRVGVVGVVDDDRAVGHVVQLHPPP